MANSQENKEHLLRQADVLLDQGRLSEAAILFRQILTLDAGDIESWLMLGAIEAESGDVAASLRCCEAVISIDPNNVEALVMKGRLLLAKGEIASAQAALEEALKIDPSDGEAWDVLAGVYLKLNLFHEAVRCGREAIRFQPLVPDGYINLGSALAGAGQLDEASRMCLAATRLDGRNGLAWGSLALVWERSGNWIEAKRAYNNMLQLLPGYVSGLVGLARVHLEMEEWDDAEKVLNSALKVCATDAEVFRNFGRLYSNRNDLVQAEQCFRQAIRIASDNISALIDFGNFLQNQQRFAEAETCYELALQTNKELPDAYFNLGVCKQRQGSYPDAQLCFDQAINYRNDFIEAHWYQAFVCLLVGDFARGWNEYEWRLKQKQNIQRPFGRPIWDGSSLVGRTILIHDEQGYGDTFQFVRYLPLVKAMGGRIVFECHSKLGAILKGCDGYDELIERSSYEQVPEGEFDTQIHLLSLPRIFQSQSGTIPNKVPYIKVNGDLIARWRERISNDTNFKIGIAWAGSANHTNELNRSCPLKAFQAIADMAGVSLYSLQKGLGTELEDFPSAEVGLIRIDKELDLTERFVDTAALMVNLDLVITIDTSIAHLAGGLGCPVWTLLCASPDWRWLAEGAKSEWYPTMRLFRQTHPGNWDDVMSEVKSALTKLIQDKCGADV